MYIMYEKLLKAKIFQFFMYFLKAAFETPSLFKEYKGLFIGEIKNRSLIRLLDRFSSGVFFGFDSFKLSSLLKNFPESISLKFSSKFSSNLKEDAVKLSSLLLSRTFNRFSSAVRSIEKFLLVTSLLL